MRAAFFSFGLACVWIVTPAFSQTPQAPANQPDDHASAYYDFAMAHLYGELAGAYGNRGEYVNKAIDMYRSAIKADPSNTYIAEQLTEFYVQVGQLDKALQEADSLLKANPANNEARKILARIYARQIGDPEQGRIDQTMLKNAIEQYEKITQQDSKDTESFSMLARLYRVSHDDAKAEAAYRQVLKINADDEDALNGLAMVFAERGDLPSAIDLLKKVVEKNPDPRTLVMLGQFYEQTKDYSDAADTLKEALAQANDNVQLQRQWAVDLYAAGRLDEALGAFRDLAKDDPKNVNLQLQIAELLERKHDYAGAGAALAKAKAIENSPEVRYAEAVLLRVQGKTPEAITAVQALLNDTKKDQYSKEEISQRREILLGLAGMEEDAGKTQETVAALKQISDLDPSLTSKVEAQIVGALRQGKDYKQARQEADSALKKFPTERAIILQHAGVLGDLGQAEGAVNELKAVPNSSKDMEILLTIAQVQDKARKFDDEKKTLDASAAVAKDPGEKQQIEFMRGAMYEREKNYEEAEKTFRGILASDPQNSGAMNYLGYMFAERDVNLDEAQQLLLKALDLEPGNGAYEDSLGWIYYRENKLEQAADVLRKAVEKVGSDPTVHDHLGDVYFKQGKVREAIQQWETSVSGWKTAVPGDQDPIELAKVTKKLEGAKVKATEKAR
ncbi:MAG TPA: tetratricopeptide repeat protein [Bryobacteraceae bacterium]|nr:tetratricopeptide repeat protein [Bryobacteraceae bacterium]